MYENRQSYYRNYFLFFKKAIALVCDHAVAVGARTARPYCHWFGTGSKMRRYSFQKRIAGLGTPVAVEFAKTGIYGDFGYSYSF